MTDADDKDIGNEMRCILEAYPQLEMRIEQKHARYQVSIGYLQRGRACSIWISHAETDRSYLADAIIDLRVKLATEAEKKAAAATAHLRALRGER